MLSVADRRWIDFITQSVNDTWDEANPGRPKTMGYVGSEEFIRLQFEEYLLSLISSVKCHNYLSANAQNSRAHLPQVDGDPSHDFGADWIEAWSRTQNYKLWTSKTDSHLFDIVEPKHPMSGGLTVDDVQRRVAQQVQDLHLDERFAVGKEVLGRNLAAGKDKASTVFNKIYADIELLRENQRKRAEDQRALAEKNGTMTPTTPGFTPDMAKAGVAVQSVGTKAGAYMSSWASWAGEKRKAAGWGAARPPSSTNVDGRGSAHGNGNRTSEKERRSNMPRNVVTEKKALRRSVVNERPGTQDSMGFGESIFDADVRNGNGNGYHNGTEDGIENGDDVVELPEHISSPVEKNGVVDHAGDEHVEAPVHATHEETSV